MQQKRTSEYEYRYAKRGKKRAGRKPGVVVLFIIIIVLIGALYILFSGSPWKDGSANTQAVTGGQDSPAASGGQGSSAATGDGGAADANVDPGAADGGVSSLWYYDATRADRYDAFAAQNPDLSMDDVVWMVDVDLDVPPYTEQHAVPDPTSLSLLVNKHFNLPENYTPSDLVSIGNSMLRSDAADAMNQMISDAAAEGHKLWVQSGFRSYSVQTNLYNQYSARDGADVADTYSARPGNSEHQTGWAADLNTITDAFGQTPEGIWAAENCWKYGFILRYTEENTDVTLYRPEPWHMRYIGTDAAAEMHSLGFLSYEEYWVKYVEYSPSPVG